MLGRLLLRTSAPAGSAGCGHCGGCGHCDDSWSERALKRELLAAVIQNIHTLSFARQRTSNVGNLPNKASKSQANTYSALAEQEADCSLKNSALQRRHHIFVSFASWISGYPDQER
ncbi:uncharacterized protein BDW70DRAFT_132269 [Aspergillus foveolatus]|uniref:uncharacterized protein n=1 Tax=Aspergillus foveolatus TaxID=210207 RepID=UPI003CCDBB62